MSPDGLIGRDAAAAILEALDRDRPPVRTGRGCGLTPGYPNGVSNRPRIQALSAEECRAYRKTRLKMSQQAVADALGVRPETVSRWETGAVTFAPIQFWAYRGLLAELEKKPA